MDNVLECEARRIEAVRLEEKTDRELLLEIARALPSITPSSYTTYMGSICEFIATNLYLEFRKKKFEHTVSFVLSYETVDSQGTLGGMFDIVNTLDLTEIRDKINQEAKKVAAQFVKEVPESKLVRVKIGIKTFNRMER